MQADHHERRMELDYRDFAEVSEEDVHNAISVAQEFVSAIKVLTEYQEFNNVTEKTEESADD